MAAAGAGASAAVPSRRIGQRGLRGWVVSSRRSRRIISLARTAAVCGGTEVLNMGVGGSYRHIASSILVGSEGKSDEHRTARFVRDRRRPVHPHPLCCSWQVYAGHSRLGTTTISPGLRLAGEGRQRQAHR
eukprot:6193291-Pleurochrysis_carterae.AAC.3